MRTKATLSETDFNAWAEKATKKEVDEYLEPIEEGKTVSFVNPYWGHIFHGAKHGEMFWKGWGFYDSFLKTPLKAGDFFLLKLDGGKIGKFVVAKIDFQRNPKDRFDAFLVGIDYDYKK